MQRSALDSTPCLRVMVFNTQPPHLYIGGVETRIREVAARLHPLVETTVVSGSKRGFKVAQNIDNVTYLPLHSTDSFYPLDNWVFNRSLRSRAVELEADIYECHNDSAYGFFKTLKQQHRTNRFIATIHGPLADEYHQAKTDPTKTMKNKFANFAMKQLSNVERDLAQQAQTIVTVSQYSKQKIIQYYNVEPSKIMVIPNGVDCQRFQPLTDTEAVKTKLDLAGKLCVLFVGQLIPRKGLFFLVEAAKKIVAQQKNAVFLVAGDGPLKQSLNEKVAQLGLGGHFYFLGSVTGQKLVELYGCADVFVLPSLTEGQGIVLLEAQATAKPVVAFNVGAVSETVQDGTSGLLVAPDSDALADAVIRLLADASLRRRMGDAGRIFVEKTYSWDICAQRMLALYTKLGT